ncbi:MAG: glycosyltransferase [Pseudomonadota bacterium]|uniref:glycosyltransferase n=1 Tax=Thermithiobacillus tepidarius TaxID=929 RepID=UPI0004186061|nr:glycosyltransferase [Thermithiobacillus tepidarius]
MEKSRPDNFSSAEPQQRLAPQQRLIKHGSTAHSELSLIVHSHLRWDFVWQRPQQILSRLAERYPVLFVEEPVFTEEAAQGQLEVAAVHANVLRVIPRLTAALRDARDAAQTRVRDLLQDFLRSSEHLTRRFQQPVQWFYTPMPAPVMLGQFGEIGVVYDCMDELSKFRFAPAELIEREIQLMEAADVVFTGGYKLYEAKACKHDNVHFFGCGVDVAHFQKAQSPATKVPADVAAVPGPVLGFYGVIDERLDYELLRKLAAARSDWSLVMVGPVVKVDPAELPRADNIHWLGQKDFSELPAYVKAFDVCLMPFALNEATEYINPTKTLEYMAAAKPIVSTAVADVIRNFTPIVRVAHSHEQFVQTVTEALAAEPELLAQGVARAAASTWTAIVAEMEQIMCNAVLGGQSPAVAGAV